MKKLSIPRAKGQPDQRWLDAVRDNLEVITGRRGKIEPLPPDATLEQVVAKINEILQRLQD